MNQLSEKDNLIIQMFASVIMLVELQSKDFTNSEYFKSLQFQNSGIKKIIEKIGIGNQGVLLMFLYGMLVMPRGLDLKTEYPEDYKNVNDFVKSKATNVVSTYTSDQPDIDFLYHIRNSVAHSRVKMAETNFIIQDQKGKNGKGGSFSCEISRENIGGVVHLLQYPFLKYINKLQ